MGTISLNVSLQKFQKDTSKTIQIKAQQVFIENIKEKYKNMIINVSLFVIFFIILGIILLYKYKGKLTPSEKNMKNIEKQQYILSKIKNYQDAKLRSQQSLITGLPQWDDEYDFTHKKIGKF